MVNSYKGWQIWNYFWKYGNTILFRLKKKKENTQSVLTASIKRKQKYIRNPVSHQFQKLTL